MKSIRKILAVVLGVLMVVCLLTRLRLQGRRRRRDHR
jgi:hypothetical protein